jgi:hypothetical protein
MAKTAPTRPACGPTRLKRPPAREPEWTPRQWPWAARTPCRSATWRFELIARLRSAVPVLLVLGGSSSVPQDDLRKAAGAGITKLNIGIVLHGRFTSAIRAHLASDDTVTDPRSTSPRSAWTSPRP